MYMCVCMCVWVQNIFLYPQEMGAKGRPNKRPPGMASYIFPNSHYHRLI